MNISRHLVALALPSDFRTQTLLETETDKSTSGFVFILSGGAISWRSKKKSITAQSTVEAEYISMSFAVRELIWLRRMSLDTGVSTLSGLKLYSDNEGAISLSRNDVANERTKHIEVIFHFVKDHVAKGSVVLKYIKTEEMTADIMTKALGSVKHAKFTKAMGMS